jgi:hypothetical protein
MKRRELYGWLAAIAFVAAISMAQRQHDLMRMRAVLDALTPVRHAHAEAFECAGAGRAQRAYLVRVNRPGQLKRGGLMWAWCADGTIWSRYPGAHGVEKLRRYVSASITWGDRPLGGASDARVTNAIALQYSPTFKKAAQP